MAEIWPLNIGTHVSCCAFSMLESQYVRECCLAHVQILGVKYSSTYILLEHSNYKLLQVLFLISLKTV